MTFLQPLLLFGLPLIALPVLIHLFNRLRYRTLPWAAMMFLLSATRQSTRHEKLRHILVLLFRTLALVAFLLAMARPLVGGWLGWAMSRAPDTVILLLDRSASMEQFDVVNQITKREMAIARFREAAGTTGQGSRYVLIDSATRTPQEISGPDVLSALTQAGPSDTAADIPALLDAAVDYVSGTQPGETEIWLASDFQSSNWQPASPRWETFRERMASLPQQVRVRLLALTDPGEDNMSLALRGVSRQKTSTGYELLITAETTRPSTKSATVPLTIVHEGARSTVEMTIEDQQLRFQHKLDLGDRVKAGWGYAELPADSNNGDNTAFFAYGDEVHQQTIVVAPSSPAQRILAVAAAPAPGILNHSSKTVSPSEAGTLKLDDVAMVAWQAPLPSAASAAALQRFVESGGVMVCFPSGEPAPTGTATMLFGETGWGDAESAASDKPWRVGAWNTEDGPLASTRQGQDLPVTDLAIAKRQDIVKGGSVLATFEDGKPFLTRLRMGRGAVYFCATLPLTDWSSLDDGMVLVPMMQRMLAEGGARLGGAIGVNCGEPMPGGAEEDWVRVDDATRSSSMTGLVTVDGRMMPTFAGVYRRGSLMAAVNRPELENLWETIDEAKTRELFGAIPLRLFEEKAGAASKLQSEIWRTFLWIMLLFLIGEALLALPGKPAPSTFAAPSAGASALAGAGKGGA